MKYSLLFFAFFSCISLKINAMQGWLNTAQKKCTSFLDGWSYNDEMNEALAKHLDEAGALQLVSDSTIYTQKMPEITRYLEQGANPRIKDKQGYSLIHWAAAAGDCALLDFLLKNNVLLDEESPHGRTVLMITAFYGHKEAFEQLLNAGASVMSKNCLGWDALFYACLSGREAMVLRLIDLGLNINAVADNGDTSFMYAAKYRNAEFLNFLVALGADISAVNQLGWNALNNAASRENCGALEFLLKLGCNIEHNNKAGETPLFIACRAGRKAAARLLLNYGADINCRDEKENNVLIAAAKAGKPDVVLFLISAGANINEFNRARTNALDACVNRCKELSLDVKKLDSASKEFKQKQACYEECRSLVAYLKPYLWKENKLLAHENLFHKVVRLSNEDALAFCTDVGHHSKMVNEPDSFGNRPLDVAFVKRNKCAIYKLLSLKAIPFLCRYDCYFFIALIFNDRADELREPVLDLFEQRLFDYATAVMSLLDAFKCLPLEVHYLIAQMMQQLK